MWANRPCSTARRQALALVDDQPGVTRDLREGDARLGDLRFTVIDTAGWKRPPTTACRGGCGA
jgi:GTP-binding protein